MEDLKIKLEALEADSLAKDEKIKELETKLNAIEAVQPVREEKKPAPKLPEKTFKVGKDEFRFKAAAFRTEKGKITAEEALKDKDLLKNLVESKAGIIEKV
jgi:hypothetical protein